MESLRGSPSAAIFVRIIRGGRISSGSDQTAKPCFITSDPTAGLFSDPTGKPRYSNKLPGQLESDARLDERAFPVLRPGIQRGGASTGVITLALSMTARRTLRGLNPNPGASLLWPGSAEDSESLPSPTDQNFYRCCGKAAPERQGFSLAS